MPTPTMTEEALICLHGGDVHPYDDPGFDPNDPWWEDENHVSPDPSPAKDWAHRAARGIVNDLLDRRDIKFGFHGVVEETRREIVETMAEIIRVAYATTWRDA